MSSRGPMWYCHGCHAEMRPLMVPDPICASCNSSFVEKIENPSEDPRQFRHHSDDGFNDADDFAMEGFLRALRGGMGPGRGPYGTRTRSPPIPRSPDRTTGSSGFHFEIHSGPGGGSRTFILGGPNTLGRSPTQGDRPVPTMSDFLHRENDPDNRAQNDISGPLMSQYLLTLLGREPTGRGDPFSEFLGDIQNGRWGDYVFNQDALDQIMNQPRGNSTAGRPVPATEETTENLPKVLTEGSPLLEKNCAVCKEQFKLETEDPGELVAMTLPCKHLFHEGCILPWLEISRTCPLCRYALIAQPQPQPPGGSPGGSSGSRPTSPSSGSRPRSPGGSSRALFGGGAGGNSSGSSGNYSARSPFGLGGATQNGASGGSSRTSPRMSGQCRGYSLI
ncbi:hypothetical protein HYDPIDRAFT_177117 [Hydnomerulius pinastri MD-312]|uniref:RING-type domain-containing protein n=1 Tax=Hydnomerulius pinastri MD-312 TaxID=994086 RepID=A0A0C9WBY1_9AGAM|nr:hypothetical protein HYDPIDRAFT_177117 [Hydnomerulius pinastri MD-312]